MRENLARRYSRYYVYLEPIVADPMVQGYFSLIASLLLISFFLVFALSPTINTILELRKKIAEQQKVDTALQQKITDLVTAQENFSQTQPILPIMLTAMPTLPTPQTIIIGLVKSASGSGVILSNFGFTELPLSPDLIKAASLTPIDINFSASGLQAQVRSFLGQLENNSRIIKIKTIGLTKPSSGSTISISVSSEAYYLSDKSL